MLRHIKNLKIVLTGFDISLSKSILLKVKSDHRSKFSNLSYWLPVEALIFFQASSFQLLKLDNLLR